MDDSTANFIVFNALLMTYWILLWITARKFELGDKHGTVFMGGIALAVLLGCIKLL